MTRRSVRVSWSDFFVIQNFGVMRNQLTCGLKCLKTNSSGYEKTWTFQTCWQFSQLGTSIFKHGCDRPRPRLHFISSSPPRKEELSWNLCLIQWERERILKLTELWSSAHFSKFREYVFLRRSNLTTCKHEKKTKSPFITVSWIQFLQKVNKIS